MSEEDLYASGASPSYFGYDENPLGTSEMQMHSTFTEEPGAGDTLVVAGYFMICLTLLGIILGTVFYLNVTGNGFSTETSENGAGPEGESRIAVPTGKAGGRGHTGGVAGGFPTGRATGGDGIGAGVSSKPPLETTRMPFQEPNTPPPLQTGPTLSVQPIAPPTIKLPVLPPVTLTAPATVKTLVPPTVKATVPATVMPPVQRTVETQVPPTVKATVPATVIPPGQPTVKTTVPPAVKTQPTPPPIQPTPPTKATPNPKQEIYQLVCTIGKPAVQGLKYPPDGLCHYLYYAHLNETANTIKDPSFLLFKQQAPSFRMTRFGISFDMRYVLQGTFGHSGDKKTLQTWKELNNIRDYGVLNAFAQLGQIWKYHEQLKLYFEDMQKFQETFTKPGDEKAKRMLAIGLYRYTGRNVFENYTEWFAKATTLNLDTVIAISSTTEYSIVHHCDAAPPDVLLGTDFHFPEIVRHSQLVRANLKYNDKVSVGLSLQMGALLYVLKQSYRHAEDTLYRACLSLVTTGLNVGCEGDEPKHLEDRYTYVAFGAGKKNITVLYNLAPAIEKKMMFFKEISVPRRFTWLYMDLQWADFKDACQQKNPFKNIETLKQAFGIGERPKT